MATTELAEIDFPFVFKRKNRSAVDILSVIQSSKVVNYQYQREESSANIIRVHTGVPTEMVHMSF